MTECLQTKKSNCKNCYKCIRHCPVKSLKFTDGQAHIVRDECVLCGECYVVCPQNAKQIRSDVEKAKQLVLQYDVYASIAPSFVAWFHNKSIHDMEQALIKLGFKGADETAKGAYIVKRQYEKMIEDKKSRIIISSCCHTVNTLIQRHYTGAIPYLADVLSPMLAHAQMLKDEHKGAKVVFIGPCISKKDEAEKYKGYVELVLTFDELDEWLKSENITIDSQKSECKVGRTRSFPVSGGIIGSMDKTPGYHYMIVDGMENCINALENIESEEIDNCFIEMSACRGSCINGPPARRKNSNIVGSILAVNQNTGAKDFSVFVPDSEKLKKEIRFEGVHKIMPGGTAVEEILKKMGKTSIEQELNCGSCGYDTCRDKAIAVLNGKADLTMCLPYLKEKAESFSDAIIKNTPNGVIVLNEDLEIQQINNAAKGILNISPSTDLLGSPVSRILDPIDYILALKEGKNCYYKRKYFAEYKKYVDETIIYDKEYHVIIIIMKDVTQEEKIKALKNKQSEAAIEIADKVVEKQMRVVQEIALLLGETTAETKIALAKLKETMEDE
ncbi:[Fe-Fe] hydrogenase large subunit C-terminal domain-containing protein [Acetivibrio straminisolvens]|uniref:[Fe-Fe] hydrogenase large subunit C-terminal domain-containing protein n=1 Tax=Acetivibrio straminisolvens TaxID=253314 RepID=UPI00223E9D4A|nr:[Fe-Fe] hydrogenase large subunit C-terminal domain-containing protein [Acetivibrio straminisolvens]